MPRSVTAFAPGRVNLLGEHTDYNDGLALPGPGSAPPDGAVQVTPGPGARLVDRSAG
jgi:galactokinase